MSSSVGPMVEEQAPGIDPRNLLWSVLAIGVMIAAIQFDNRWLLNFLHVIAGVLWTGIDLFMGFVLGPIMRRLPLPARRAVILRLMPKMLFLMPTLSILTSTAGYYHAKQIGFLDIGYPEFGWVLAALIIVGILTVQGMGLLLPTNLRVYLELRKPAPDGAKIGRLMQRYIVYTAMQGIGQVAIIVVMARFVTGL